LFFAVSLGLSGGGGGFGFFLVDFTGFGSFGGGIPSAEWKIWRGVWTGGSSCSIVTAKPWGFSSGKVEVCVGW
jgi:hypothetical protein